jgi:hypothetical protein
VKRVFQILLVILCVTPLAYAQFDTATVLGTIRDKTGAAISGAKITIENLDTGIQATKATDDSGNYEFPGFVAT